MHIYLNTFPWPTTLFLWIPGQDGTRSKVTGNILVNALHAFHRFNGRYHVISSFFCLFVSNADPATQAFGSRYTTYRTGTVTHFQFLHHFGELHCRMICNCRYDKVSMMSVCVYRYILYRDLTHVNNSYIAAKRKISPTITSVVTFQYRISTSKI